MNEEEYTKNEIIPLLKYMGFMEVTNNHGITEFGKDIVFSEYDRFGNKKYYAAQIKSGNISGSNQSQLNNLKSQAYNAFSVTFPDLISKTEIQISDFYIIISGKYVGNAKESILRDPEIQKYKHRIHFLQGSNIEELRERYNKEVKELFLAQLNELSRNKHLLKLVIDEHIFEHKNFNKLIDFNTTKLINKLVLYKEKRELLELLTNYYSHCIRYNDLYRWLLLDLPNITHEKKVNYVNDHAKSLYITIEKIEMEINTIIKNDIS